MASPTVDRDDIVGLLRPPGPDDHKYSRGVVGLLVGSTEYPGAAVLVAEAALHAGVGMARLSAPSGVEQLVLHSRPEVVISPGKVDALVLGCGIPDNHGEDIASRLEHFDYSEETARVVDAGALLQGPWLPGPAVLTPHGGELARLASALRLPGETAASWAGALAATWNAVVLLKGHQTQVFLPSGVIHRLPPATAWLASAGTGDVLAGVLGALLAHGSSEPWTEERLGLFAAAAALIHAEAAQRVSVQSGAGRPGPILALELARAIGPVVAALVSGSDLD